MTEPDFALPDDDKCTTTSSGLMYQVVQKGEGAAPGPKDRVTVHYSGWLTDGQAFDSSYQRGTPASFPLDGVIAGWTEGVQLMQPGSVFRFIIPPDLAYGSRGAPPTIGANETLVFQVELLSIG